eukprot:Nk52_evm12s211 gene=Nk52_evmTU12s211
MGAEQSSLRKSSNASRVDRNREFSKANSRKLTKGKGTISSACDMGEVKGNSRKVQAEKKRAMNSSSVAEKGGYESDRKTNRAERQGKHLSKTMMQHLSLSSLTSALDSMEFDYFNNADCFGGNTETDTTSSAKNEKTQRVKELVLLGEKKIPAMLKQDRRSEKKSRRTRERAVRKTGLFTTTSRALSALTLNIAESDGGNIDLEKQYLPPHMKRKEEQKPVLGIKSHSKSNKGIPESEKKCNHVLQPHVEASVLDEVLQQYSSYDDDVFITSDANEYVEKLSFGETEDLPFSASSGRPTFLTTSKGPFPYKYTTCWTAEELWNLAKPFSRCTMFHQRRSKLDMSPVADVLRL